VLADTRAGASKGEHACDAFARSGSSFVPWSGGDARPKELAEIIGDVAKAHAAGN
jgi:hypothetical protein